MANSECAAVHRAPDDEGPSWDQDSLIPSVVKLTRPFFVHTPQVLEVG